MRIAHILDVTRPDTKQLAPFIDPELNAGDLLITNQHTWHSAPRWHSYGRPLRNLP